MFRGQIKTYMPKDAPRPGSRRNTEYELIFSGGRRLFIRAASDPEALETLRDELGLSKLTLESFARAGCRQFMCGSRQVFPNPKANA